MPEIISSKNWSLHNCLPEGEVDMHIRAKLIRERCGYFPFWLAHNYWWRFPRSASSTLFHFPFRDLCYRLGNFHWLLSVNLTRHDITALSSSQSHIPSCVDNCVPIPFTPFGTKTMASTIALSIRPRGTIHRAPWLYGTVIKCGRGKT